MTLGHLFMTHHYDNIVDLNRMAKNFCNSILGENNNCLPIYACNTNCMIFLNSIFLGRI